MAKVMARVIMLVGLCFFAPLQAQNNGPVQSQTQQRVSTYLESNSETSIFVAALKQSDLWNQLNQSDALTVFVPTNETLHKEGAAFLLEVVLNKIENKDRLDDLMATHVFVQDFQIDAKANGRFGIPVPHGGCFIVTSVGGLINIGPQAQVTGSVKAENGNIHFVNHLLWVPYKELNNCDDQGLLD